MTLTTKHITVIAILAISLTVAFTASATAQETADTGNEALDKELTLAALVELEENIRCSSPGADINTRINRLRLELTHIEGGLQEVDACEKRVRNMLANELTLIEATTAHDIAHDAKLIAAQKAATTIGSLRSNRETLLTRHAEIEAELAAKEEQKVLELAACAAGYASPADTPVPGEEASALLVELGHD